ncbi:MAG TPA: PAC2 family protein, partial [Halobacteriales archaeon]|nr:PAC2 family protein [Halobacteriales archaeon]
SRPDLDVVVLVNELFVPLYATDALARSILEWTDDYGIEEIAVLAGVPVAHGPEEHRVFHVATEDYREHRLDGVDIPGMGNGFLDGVNASLLSRGLDTDLRTGIFLTPVHAQAPDVEAALRLIDGFEAVYGLDVDSGPLEAFAKEVQQYYRELAGRLQNVEQANMPEDRMYM